jgi:hypothetical protein
VKELAENPLIHSLLQIHVLQDDERTVPAQFQFGPFGDWRFRRQTAKVPAPVWNPLSGASPSLRPRAALRRIAWTGISPPRRAESSRRIHMPHQVVLISQREFR